MHDLENGAIGRGKPAARAENKMTFGGLSQIGRIAMRVRDLARYVARSPVACTRI